MKNARTESAKNKKISIILLTSAIWALSIAILGFLNEYTNLHTISFDFAKQKVSAYAANRTIDNGEILKQSDICIKEVDSNLAVNGGINSINQLVGKKATHKIYKNETFTSSDIIKPQIVSDNLVECTIPVNLSVLHDNKIKANDYVDIIIDYKEKVNKTRTNTENKVEKYTVNKPSEVVAGKVLVTQIIDNKGNLIVAPELQDPESRQQPAYVSVLVKKDLINNIMDAKKRGSLNLIKYLDPSKEKAIENYKPSWLN
ncbi:SAF domain-containing protein [Clostridium tyrobutyricum]|jgi:Flp pilus assembly protein CpaB|uniref:SAF domain-containing protein n=1 Tax=Clostridium tyrobutyricum TaxID=1519 RepID=UPI000E9A9021|nr:SAF domain-containing protein [Clostridium tyrobutyricum]HBF77794.1 hypothetical protein [Clostridiaceae bacterium]HBG39076.1 hypothetical protein [Clostridiaceae bacterium]